MTYLYSTTLSAIFWCNAISLQKQAWDDKRRSVWKEILGMKKGTKNARRVAAMKISNVFLIVVSSTLSICKFVMRYILKLWRLLNLLKISSWNTITNKKYPIKLSTGRIPRVPRASFVGFSLIEHGDQADEGGHTWATEYAYNGYIAVFPGFSSGR